MQILGLILMCCAFTLEASAQKDVVGKWKSIDDKSGKPRSIVEIYKNNGKVYGKVDAVLDKSNGENPICKDCPGERAGKPIKGMVVIRDMQANGDEWVDGYVFDPDTAKEYKCKLWREGDELKVRGYFGFMYRTQSWKKVE